MNPNATLWAWLNHNRPALALELGDIGQDRGDYSDTQDRKNYTGK